MSEPNSIKLALVMPSNPANQDASCKSNQWVVLGWYYGRTDNVQYYKTFPSRLRAEIARWCWLYFDKRM